MLHGYVCSNKIIRSGEDCIKQDIRVFPTIKDAIVDYIKHNPDNIGIAVVFTTIQNVEKLFNPVTGKINDVTKDIHFVSDMCVNIEIEELTNSMGFNIRTAIITNVIENTKYNFKRYQIIMSIEV